MALLAREGIRPKTHRGVVAEVGRLARDGAFSDDAAALLAQMLDSRLKADYGVTVGVDEDEAEEAVTAAREFLTAVREAFAKEPP